VKQGDVCWVVDYTGAIEKKVVKTRVARVIDAHPGRSGVVIKTEEGNHVMSVAVFDHAPKLVTLLDEYGSFTKWV